MLWSRRYSQLVASMITLQGGSDSWGVGGGGENMIQHDLTLMRQEMISLLEKLSALLNTVKDRRVFFINNYDQVSITVSFAILC